MDRRPVLTRDDLARPFVPLPDGIEQVGIELECGLVDPETGRSVSYDGPCGAREVLTTLAKSLHGTPVAEGSHILSVELGSGASFSLEMGGALEFSSTPQSSVHEAVQQTRTHIEQAADALRHLPVAILPGGMLPFTSMADVPWIPKRRVGIMRHYFAGLGDQGSLADGVMGLTLSTQTSLDYTSEDDLLSKLRIQTLAAPVASALFVNSPIESGVPVGVLSRRMQLWRKIDPSRCGILDYALDPQSSAQSIVDWALALPMIYRKTTNGSHSAAPSVAFGDALHRGFGDGTWPTHDDWVSLLSQVWPHVRVRRTLEMRLPDGLPWPHFGSSVAFWVGLSYDEASRIKVLDLLGNFTFDDLDTAVSDVAIKGLAANVGAYQVQDVARELLAIARQGLASRVARRLDREGTPAYLDPLEEVLETSTTFADRCLTRWDGDLRRNAAAYVRAFRVP